LDDVEDGELPCLPILACAFGAPQRVVEEVVRVFKEAHSYLLHAAPSLEVEESCPRLKSVAAPGQTLEALVRDELRGARPAMMTERCRRR
jgi:hypothetical protein